MTYRLRYVGDISFLEKVYVGDETDLKGQAGKHFTELCYRVI